MKTITFRHLGNEQFETIKCKRWYPTKTGLVYIDFCNEEKHEFENYVNNSDLVLWSIQ